MLQLKNNTPLEAKILLMPNPDGIDSLYTIIKATFNLDQQLTLAEQQIPIVDEDQYLDLHYGGLVDQLWGRKSRN